MDKLFNPASMIRTLFLIVAFIALVVWASWVVNTSAINSHISNWALQIILSLFISGLIMFSNFLMALDDQ